MDAVALLQRQNNSEPGDNGQGAQNNDSNTFDTAVGVRYGITGLVFAFIIFIAFGFWHGLRRQRKNLPLMRYHRWMFKNRAPPRLYSGNTGQPSIWNYASNQRNPDRQMPNNWYLMSSRRGPAPPPPPAYHENIPPAYQPPLGVPKSAPPPILAELPSSGIAERNQSSL